MGLQFLSRSGTGSFNTGLMAMAAIALVSCGGEPPADPEPSSTTDESIPMVQGEPLEAQPSNPDNQALDNKALDDKAFDDKTNTKTALEAGAYCYRTDEPKLQAIAELLVEPDKSVTGTLAATVTDAANGYYTSYDQTLAGELKGDQLTASITTNIEDDVQQTNETWTLNDKQLSSDSAIFLKRVNCEEIIALKIAQKSDPSSKPVAIAPTTIPKPTPAPSLSPSPSPTPTTTSSPTSTSTPTPTATTPTATPTVVTPPPTAPSPQPSVAPSTPITVAFNSGETETVMKGNLAAGQSQTYLIAAQEGQDMYLEIINDSGKAVFDVEVDNGEYIQGDLPEFIDFTLPFDGTYIVTVKASENNTNFALTVRIQ